MPRDGAIIPPILRNLDLGPYSNTIKIERMARRIPSRRSAKSREFSLGVKVAVRWGAFGKRLNAMVAFHKQRGIHVALARQRHEDQDYVFWFFARREIAEEFAAEFGGTLMDDSRRQARGR